MKNKSIQSTDRISLVEQWKQSGKSVTEFCKKEKINYWTLYYWQRKLSKQKKTSTPGFIKLKTVSPSSVHLHFCELITRNGNRLIFHKQVEVSFLKQLL